MNLRRLLSSKTTPFLEGSTGIGQYIMIMEHIGMGGLLLVAILYTPASSSANECMDVPFCTVLVGTAVCVMKKLIVSMHQSSNLEIMRLQLVTWISYCNLGDLLAERNCRPFQDSLPSLRILILNPCC